MANKPTPPKGKVKGGARFPRHDLKACFAWAKKLAAKTHGGPQPEDVILAGVVETKGPSGEVKISAMRQFGLIEGDKSAYCASQLAKDAVNCPENERTTYLQKLALNPSLFLAAFNTFQGDKVLLAKVRQRFTDLNVHPDNADACVKIYAASLEFAGLGKTDGDHFDHASSIGLSVTEKSDTDGDSNTESELSDQKNEEQEIETLPDLLGRRRTNAVITVNVNLDSSLDTEKLERQLKLLKKYGAI